MKTFSGVYTLIVLVINFQPLNKICSGFIRICVFCKVEKSNLNCTSNSNFGSFALRFQKAYTYFEVHVIWKLDLYILIYKYKIWDILLKFSCSILRCIST